MDGRRAYHEPTLSGHDPYDLRSLMVNNRGQAATAETTVTSIGRSTMTDTYTMFSQ